MFTLIPLRTISGTGRPPCSRLLATPAPSTASPDAREQKLDIAFKSVDAMPDDLGLSREESCHLLSIIDLGAEVSCGFVDIRKGHPKTSLSRWSKITFVISMADQHRGSSSANVVSRRARCAQ